MRSKKKKLLFIFFSTLIMIGLCIGVFADFNSDRIGTVVGSNPFDLGDKVFDVSNSNQGIEGETYYIYKFTYNHLIETDENTQFMLVNSQTGSYYYENGIFYFCYTNGKVVEFTMNVGETYYIYCWFNAGHVIKYSAANYNGYNCSCSVYTVSDEYTIDIYDNSQDVWASVVSVVSDATDSVINNDILLLFAAAIPVLSFGVGMLIRLVHKS